MLARNTLLRTAALSVCFAAVAGCTQRLGADAETTALRGHTERVQLAEGSGAVDQFTIDASALERGKKYSLPKGVLVIVGDVPEKTRVDVEFGRLIVQGNVGKKAELHAYMPESSRTDVSSCNRGRVRTTCVTTTKTGLTFASDHTAGIKVYGTVASGTITYSNAGVWLQCAEHYDDVDMGQSAWGRPSVLKQIGNCKKTVKPSRLLPSAAFSWPVVPSRISAG